MSTVTNGRMRIVSPEGPTAAPKEFRLAPGLDDLSGRHFAFVSNTKLNIDLLLQTYAELLNDRYGISADHARKPNAGVGAGPLIKELSTRAHGIVTGIGD